MVVVVAVDLLFGCLYCCVFGVSYFRLVFVLVCCGGVVTVTAGFC